MSSSYEVISAFLDAEPFDAEELDRALSDPAGRALLIDLSTLRRIVQPADQLPAMRAPALVRRPVWKTAAAAAGLLLALAGGYLAGERGASVPPSADAPPPTRVVQAVPFVP